MLYMIGLLYLNDSHHCHKETKYQKTVIPFPIIRKHMKLERDELQVVVETAFYINDCVSVLLIMILQVKLFMSST
jgi:hypothetical protein